MIMHFTGFLPYEFSSSLSVNSISSQVTTVHVSESVSVVALIATFVSFLYLSSILSLNHLAVFTSQSLMDFAMVLSAREPTYS